MGEITLGPNWSNATYDDLRRDLPSGVQVTMVRKKSQNVVPAADLLLEPGDGLLVIADRQEAINDAAARLGKLDPGRIVKDRSALDYIRVFVAKANLIGVPLARLPLPSGFPVHLLHVMLDATMWISFPPPIWRWNMATGSACCCRRRKRKRYGGISAIP